MSIFFKKFGPYSKLRTVNRPIAWPKQTQPYNNDSYVQLSSHLSKFFLALPNDPTTISRNSLHGSHVPHRCKFSFMLLIFSPFSFSFQQSPYPLSNIYNGRKYGLHFHLSRHITDIRGIPSSCEYGISYVVGPESLFLACANKCFSLNLQVCFS